MDRLGVIKRGGRGAERAFRTFSFQVIDSLHKSFTDGEQIEKIQGVLERSAADGLGFDSAPSAGLCFVFSRILLWLSAPIARRTETNPRENE